MLDLEPIEARLHDHANHTLSNNAFASHARSDIPALVAEVERLHQQEMLLVEALNYYTEEKIYTWLPYRHPCRGPTRYTAPSIISDGGRKAKKALAELKLAELKNEDAICLT